MCGRFTLRTPIHEIATLFDVEVDEVPPRFNIAPTQAVAVIRADAEGRRQLSFLHWGLIPFWADDPKIGNRMINARAESVATKPAFRQAFRKRRCLVVADGFYEWQKTGGKRKQPYFIHRKDDRPFAFAGLWESWRREGEVIESCAIITTDANDLMRPIHDRMPVIISPEEYPLWLDPKVQDDTSLQHLLQPAPPEDLEAYPIGTLVNSPANESPDCIRPVE